MAVCQITLVGNLGRDPEMRYSKDGKAVTTMNVAVSHGRKQPDGTWTDETDWFRVSVFGPAAERAAEKLRRGSRVCVVGRFSTRSYEKDGVTRLSLEVAASECVPLDKSAPGGSVAATEGVDVSEVPF